VSYDRAYGAAAARPCAERRYQLGDRATTWVVATGATGAPFIIPAAAQNAPPPYITPPKQNKTKRPETKRHR